MISVTTEFKFTASGGWGGGNAKSQFARIVPLLSIIFTYTIWQLVGKF
jgi:hypothetical protein